MVMGGRSFCALLHACFKWSRAAVQLHLKRPAIMCWMLRVIHETHHEPAIANVRSVVQWEAWSYIQGVNISCSWAESALAK
jgi:hypothetical protein